MIVFSTFWRIVKKYKGTILLYTVMLIMFGGINLTSNSTMICLLLLNLIFLLLIKIVIWDLLRI